MTGEYSHQLEQPVTAEKIQLKLPKFRNTAPEPDGIHSRVLNPLHEIALEALANLNTSNLKLGFGPRAWKHACVLMFPKHLKPARQTSSYSSPMLLTPTISRVFEKIHVTRIELHL